MKYITSFIVLGLVSLMAIPVANGAIISTLFARNNGGNFGGAVYFDVTVGASPITVTALETNTAELVAFTDLQVWVLTGSTAFGNETNMGLWTQVATGSGTGQGIDIPTAVTLSNSFMLGSGIHGMAIVAGADFGHDYTNGDGTNQNFSNGDLALSLGSASNVPFTAPLFNPRVWNGSIIYDVGAAVPEPATALFGLGFIGLMGLKRRRS